MESFNLLNHVPVGLFAINKDYIVVFWNNCVSDWTNITPERITGLSLLDFFPNIDKPMYTTRLESVFKGIGPVIFSSQLHSYLIPVELPDKSYRIQHTTVTAIPVSGTPHFHALFAIEDVTNLVNRISELNRVRSDLICARVKADYANNAKSNFLANMSHEIRTPLNAIIGLNYLLSNTSLNAKQKDYIEKSQNSAQNLLGIINNILDFSKIEAEKLTVECLDFNLYDVLTNLVTLVGIKAQKKNLDLVFDVSRDVPRLLIGDPLKLGQILLNLLNNAIKFTNIGNIIVSISINRQSDDEIELYFSVKDTGIGLEENKIKHLFRPFQQADTSTTRIYGGTGLGLSICKNLVEKMGGMIGVESKKDYGSNFYFTIKFEQQKANNCQKHKRLPDSLKNINALVVIENEITRSTIKDCLIDTELTVEWASNSNEAQKKIKQSNCCDDCFDLIIIDYSINQTKGLALAKKIKTDPMLFKMPSIILLSAFENEELLLQVATINIDRLLVKPISKDLLINTILGVFAQDYLPADDKTDMNSNLEWELEKIKGSNILLVEDNEINQKVIQELLKSKGFNVKIASDGESAVKILNDNSDRFKLILMDLQMPIMDGFETARRIKKQIKVKNIPIIALSADVTSGVKEKTLNSDMDDYISKPIESNTLFQKLVDWIEVDNDVLPELGSKKERKSPKVQVKIPNIVGLNVVKGLERILGNTELYHSLICSFYNKYKDFISNITKAYKEKSFDSAELQVHSLAGVSGNLGADNLHLKAKKLNQLLIEDSTNEEMFIKNLKAVELSLNELLTSIEKDIPIYEVEKKEGHDQIGGKSKSNIQLKLETLKGYLANNDGLALCYLEKNKDIFLKNGLISEINKIEKVINNYEFKLAYKQVLDLETKLQQKG